MEGKMDNHLQYSQKWKKSLTTGILLALALGGTGYAMPAGGQIQSGQGAIAQNGKTMTVTQNSGKMAVDWTQFNIAKDEAVKFTQPGRDAVALNRITGGQKSLIDGALSANGNLLLVNPNGVVFGKTSAIEVGSLVASTAQLNDTFMKSFANSTANLNLTIGEGNNSAILNQGTINAQGGLVALHAAQVENTGTISAQGGTVALAAARQLTLSPEGDGKLNYAVDGDLARAKALNSGRIQADGGYVVMTAKSAQDVLGTVVNNTGTLEAKTLRKDEKGQILLDGGDQGQVEVSGTLDASGTGEGQSAGSIKVIGQETIVHDNTSLLAKGNVDGGKIETSGDVLSLGDGMTIDAKGVNGKAGEWLLDPLDVIIADTDPTTTSNYDNAEKKNAADSDFTSGSASIGYNDPDATTANASSVNSAVTWISTDMVEKMLNAGTNVTIQAAATNGSANIIVKNDIDKTAGSDATFTLDAMRNITVDGNITSKVGKLNVVLNADSNGDQIGVVIINANIDTNGGDFTSATGGTVGYASDAGNTKGYGKGTLTGKADPAGHTVGTYFGHVDSSGTADGAKDDRLIKTGGGKITLNGEIAIGLNGGTLTLDSGGGDVTATGIINSGNSYGAYVYGTDTWDTLVEKTVESYLKSGTVPAYHYQGVNYVKDTNGNYVKNADGTYEYTTEAQEYAAGQPHYTFSEADTQNVRWLGDGSSTSVSVDKGKGYASVVITKGSMTLEQWLNYQLTYNAANFANRYISQDSGVKIVTEKVGNKTNTYVRNADGSKVTAAQFKTYLSTALANLQSDTASADSTKMLNGETVYNNLKDDISHLLATNWFASKELAQGDTKGGSAVGDSYLATITTILENSLTTPNGQQILWAGGRGSGVLNKTGSTNNDKAYPYSYYGMPDDPTYQNGMYWVTGPEGEANNGKGTQFYSNANSNWKTGNYGETVYGYVNWDTYKDGNKTRSQPDNSAPFLTVGYGTTGKWDDAAMGGDTTVGFVKETNLANSSLNIKAGSGEVKLQGDIGKAKALDTVNIESTGAVTTGTTSPDVTKYHNGTIYADHGVYISGGTVNVGGEIHSGTTDKTASESTILTRDDGYKNEKFQLDNVTIQSAGDLIVHGVESNGYTGSDDTLKGGKIKLTSTGTDGVITLGDGVDYNGKNTNGGVLKAASTANDSVVIDVQGSNGAFVNDTTGEKAIDTQGNWQVYSASPEKNTFGTNLNSGTDALWTAKSDSNEIATKNKHEIDPLAYSTVSGNKFIFQATPDITLYSDDYLKTYGDEVTEETLNRLLKGKETFIGLDGETYDVTRYNAAFKEQSYEKYVDGIEKVTITSDGSAAAATRTGGQYKATEKSGADGNKAVYDLTVNLNDAKALDGYAIDKKNGKLEIKKRTVTITSSGEQTYGDSTYTSWTDRKSGFANDDEKSFTYAHGIKSGSDYEINLNKTSGRTTADAKTYQDSVSYSNLIISGKKNADGTDDPDFFNENYTLDTANSTGSIKVNKADLTLTLKDVSTTYGKGFDSTTYGYKKDAANLQGLTNGDAAAAITDVLKDSDFTYVNGGAKSDPNNENVKTQNAGSYQITGSTTKNLDNYNIKVVNPGNSTVEKAKLTFKVGNTVTTYGSDAWTPYTYTLEGNANGDTVDDVRNHQIAVTYTNGGVKSDASNANVKTQDVGSYALNGAFTLSGDTATNYEIDTANSDMTGTATVNKATVKVKLNDVSTTYGTAFDTDTYGYDPAKIEGLTNGDGTDVVTKVLDGTYGTGNISYTNTGDASAEEKKAGKVTKTVNGGPYYLRGNTSQTLDNYNVEIEDGNATLNKATLHLSTGDYKEAYGAAAAVQSDLDKATSVTGEANGDDLDVLVSQIGIQNTSAALLSGDRTHDVKYKADGSLDGYGITTDFTKSLDNYDVVLDKAGTITLTPVEITVDNEMVQTYGSQDRSFKEVVDLGLVNGDKISTDGLQMAPKANGKYETNKGNRTTADAGTYKDDLAFSGGGIVHEDGTTEASKNYKVTIKGDIIVNKADLHVDTKDVTTPFGTVKFTTSGVQGLTNGDEKNVSDLKFNYGSYGNAYLDNNSYTNAPGRYEFTTETTNQYLDFLKNYNILGGEATVTITPVEKPVKPDITPVKPNPVPEGKGNIAEPSIQEFRGGEDHGHGGRTWYREKKSIPFFKVLDGKVTNYGTFDVESMPEKVEITPSGMRLPEPDQPKTQHREYTTSLTLPGGEGTYRLVYNGVSFNIHPMDAAALQLLEAGDPKKNEELSEAALYTGFQKMGLGLEDLKAVYVRFN